MIEASSVFTGIPAQLATEHFERLAGAGAVLIERIISRGHRSAEGFWYEQSRHEWVMVVKGSATVRWEDGGTTLLRAGDHLVIPAQCRHRVEWTDPDSDTIWVAVHYPD